MEKPSVTGSVITGDCMTLLPIAADCVVTDPPYNIGPYQTVRTVAAAGNRARVRAAKMQTNEWDEAVDFNVLAPLFAASAPSCAVFCSDEQIAEVRRALLGCYDSVATLVWVKTNARPSIAKSWFTNKTEYVVVARQAGAYFEDRGSQGNYNIIQHPFDTATVDRHPCSKGVRVAADLISRLCPIGGTVLDPFCGGGSIIRAAVAFGRNGIGIERDEEFAEMAKRNIGRPWKQSGPVTK